MNTAEDFTIYYDEGTEGWSTPEHYGLPCYPWGGTPFRDVKSSAYYNAAVIWAAENGIAAGNQDGTFAPNSPCTRAQVVSFLYRAYGQE